MAMTTAKRAKRAKARFSGSLTTRNSVTPDSAQGNAQGSVRDIRILPPEEARRIAAGEVVDRPSALVREFMDNAIDAESRNIEVIIDEGGITRTEVVDDGSGMGKEDLELCWLTHATSKIRSLDDLRTAVTLGFRGEALSSAAAVSRLEILTSRDGTEAWKLCVGPGGKPVLEQSRRTGGTGVRALGLYDTIPARKRFLKRPGSEALACRQIFNEKAMAFPEIAFRVTQDGILKVFLPPVSSLKERFSQIHLEEREGAFLHEIAARGSGFSISVVLGGPELFRKDRRLQFIFANSRRIQDYTLLQAFEYGLQGYFPNGTHPIGAVFVTIEGALADFNIHPAKREARFVDPGSLHHALSSALRDFCRRSNMASSLRTEKVPSGKAPGTFPGTIFSGALSGTPNTFAMEALLSSPPAFAPLPGRGELYAPRESAGSAAAESWTAEEAPPYAAGAGIRYLGRLFGLFILVEKGDRLFIIDQHAAHERILYDRFIRGPIPRQELLVAIPFVTESREDDSFLHEKAEELSKLGIDIRRGSGEWLIEALPSGWSLSDPETIAAILDLKNSGENMAERWAATLSCRRAVKDGDFLDEKTALALAEEAFALPVRLCPHGRPIWFELSREELFRAVRRG
ncbi:MAG: DNA mismatch repair endonuclease MutL [Treponema sp.]|jgi:DNA mismatch repair protein MutL|nr:DNA mismatch repair endonuclease MutL [Treponema sp.]